MCVKHYQRGKIRTFKREDIDKILELEAQAFPKTAYSRETLLFYAKRLPDTFFVLETSQDIAGYIIFDRGGHVHSMAVKPIHRRRGFGSMLIRHALKRVHKRLWLEVRSKNLPAIGFYKKLGLKIVGKTPNYYGDDDALIMLSDPVER